MAHHPTEDANTSPNEHFADVLAKANMSRRSLIRGGVGLFAVGSLPMLAACGGGDDVVEEKKLSFSAVGKSIADSVVLPAGYTFSVLHATGDRLVSSHPSFQLTWVWRLTTGASVWATTTMGWSFSTLAATASTARQIPVVPCWR
jgi:secreted PhoX family phosphatase